VRRLVLVRHAESEANVIGSLHCRVPGPPLTALGHEQATALVDVLADQDVRAIWASTMTRAGQTAAPLAAARGLAVRVHDDLRECDLGDLHDRHDAEAHALFDDVFAGWMLGADLTLRCPGEGAESAEEVVARMRAVLDAALAELDDGVAVVVSHGAALRLTMLTLCGLDPAFALRHHLANTGYSVVDVENGRFLCRTWGGLVPLFAGEP
jgi:probable phosphoglycerate mutase